MAMSGPVVGPRFADGPLVPDSAYGLNLGCVRSTWTGTTHVVFEFDNCHLPDRGLLLDGILEIAIKEMPLTFTLTYDQLQIGATLVDGMQSLAVGERFVAIDASVSRTEGGSDHDHRDRRHAVQDLHRVRPRRYE